MAINIETQVRDELRSFESIVSAVRSVGAFGASLEPGDMQDYACVVCFLSSHLADSFEALHITISQRLLPFLFVAGSEVGNG